MIFQIVLSKYVSVIPLMTIRWPTFQMPKRN